MADSTWWVHDMDQVKITNPQGDDPDVEITVKGRCLKCWGRLIQHGGSDATLPRLKCRVCGRTLEGSVAKQELDRMMKEVIVNLFRMDLGAVSSYEEGVFAYKAFPKVGSLSKECVLARISARRARSSASSGVVSRDDVPLGSAGWFVMQAKVLLAGVNPSIYNLGSFPDFPRSRFLRMARSAFSIRLETTLISPRRVRRR